MLSRSLSHFACTFAFFLLSGCSTPESQERLDTVLCWLRPSCLPSHPSSTPSLATSPANKVAANFPPPQRAQNISPPMRPSTKCLTSAQITVEASKPYVTVSYMEPTTKANGQQLTNLAKTTIYHDLGKGLVKYKDIPATNPQGGGSIQEKMSFPVSKGARIQVTICVTATDTNGREG